MTSRFLLFPLLLLSSLMAGCQPDNQECSGDELQSRWFRDLDGDGFGVSSDVRFSCSAPTGYAPVDGDCLDSDPRFYPLAVETSSELSDFNCDGVVSFQVIPADGVDPVTLYSPDYGELTLHIPPNALQGSEPVTLSVEVNDELNTAARPLLPYALSPVISFSPSQNFQTPITVTYPLPPWFVALDPEVTCTALGVIQLDELSAEPLWPFIPATRCELAAGSIDVELAHFSSYQVGMDADNNGQLELVGLELGPRYAEDAPIVEQHKALSVESGDALAERLYYSMAGVPVEGALEKLKWKQLRKPEALSWSTGQEPAFEERTCSSGEGCTNKYVLTAQPQNSGTQAVVEELLIWAEDVALAGTVCGMSQALYTHCSFDDGGTGMMNTMQELGATPISVTEDNDCDWTGTLWDLGTDGFPDPFECVLVQVTLNDDDQDGVSKENGDCNDNNPNIKPGATELTGDSVDQNCDGLETCFKDADNDGFRPDDASTAGSTDTDCYDANEAVSADPTTDCDDSNGSVKPGATESCNAVDDNCDGGIDEGVKLTFYQDADVDAFGNPNSTAQACTVPTGYVSNNLDCNDADASLNPNTLWTLDYDADGFGEQAQSVTTRSCTPPTRFVLDHSDCNDNNPNIKPGATESCNAVDDNCDGSIDEGVKLTFYQDADADAFGNPNSTAQACTVPTGYVSNNLDCNDADASLNPNTEWSLDWDGDGYGDSSGDTLQRQCLQPEGYVLDATDCNDEDEAVHPDALEYPGNLKDDDCDGVESDIVQVAAGLFHSLAVDDLGRVWAWGNNDHGQLGDGTPTDRYTPVLVSSLSGVTAVATGWYHSLAVKLDGTVWAWGNNDYGQLGDGTPTDRYTPVLVSSLSGVTAVAAGDRHSLAVKLDGTVWAWGYNSNGQLGDGTTTSRSTPVQVSGLSGVTAVAAGGYHSLAVKSDGTVWAWGYNGSGQLGDGTTTSRSTPVQVSGLSGVTAVAAGGYHSLAVKSDGTVWAWGYNGSGQLGDGTTTSRSTPVQVSGLTGVTAVAASYGYSLAVKSDGTVWAWGRNSEGQLGDGTTTERSTPVQVSSISGVRAVAAGGYHSLAVKLDGTVWAWGWNDYGQLGDGTTTDRKTPVQVSSISGVTAVAAGYYHSLAVKSDGTVWAWGRNSSGQLGDGTTTSRSTPVPVLWGP